AAWAGGRGADDLTDADAAWHERCEARVAARVGRYGREAQERLPLAESRRIGGVIGEEFDVESGVGRGVERAANDRMDARWSRKREDREVLQAVGTIVGVAGVV